MATPFMSTNTFDITNPFSNILEELPQAAYYSSPAGQSFAKQSPKQRSFFENQFQNIYNSYLGALGAQIREGGLPTLQLQDYLETTNPYTGTDLFSSRYQAQTPAQRGDYTSYIAPRTRFMYY